MLPKGAKVIATAVADDRIAVTIEQGGMVEVRTFDLKTLRPDRAAALRHRAVRPETLGAAWRLPVRGIEAISKALPVAPFV